MFWIGISVAVGVVVLLTWIGAALVQGNARHSRRSDGGPWIPGDFQDPDRHHHHGDDW